MSQSPSDFTDFELRVLKYCRRHRIRPETAKDKVKRRYLKTFLFLTSAGAIRMTEPYITLSQPALDALDQQRELSFIRSWRDFALGFASGILSTVFLQHAWPAFLAFLASLH